MRLLSKKQVREKVSLSFATIERKEKEGLFPKRVNLGFRVAFVEAEIDEWIKAQIAKRDTITTP